MSLNSNRVVALSLLFLVGCGPEGPEGIECTARPLPDEELATVIVGWWWSEYYGPTDVEFEGQQFLQFRADGVAERARMTDEGRLATYYEFGHYRVKGNALTVPDSDLPYLVDFHLLGYADGGMHVEFDDWRLDMVLKPVDCPQLDAKEVEPYTPEPRHDTSRLR